MSEVLIWFNSTSNGAIFIGESDFKLWNLTIDVFDTTYQSVASAKIIKKSSELKEGTKS